MLPVAGCFGCVMLLLVVIVVPFSGTGMTRAAAKASDRLDLLFQRLLPVDIRSRWDPTANSGAQVESLAGQCFI